MSQSDPTLDALKKDPQAAKLLSDPAGLKALLSAPETQQLMSLLNQSAGSGLQSAAQAAAKGKPEALMGLLNQVMNDPQGGTGRGGAEKENRQLIHHHRKGAWIWRISNHSFRPSWAMQRP